MNVQLYRNAFVFWHAKQTRALDRGVKFKLCNVIGVGEVTTLSFMLRNQWHISVAYIYKYIVRG